MIRSLLLLTLVPILAAQENPPATIAPAAEPAEQILSTPELGRFKMFFQPQRTEKVALSPDGKHLAYTYREGDAVSVVIIEIDHPEKVRARIQVLDDNGATPMFSTDQREKTPGRINWLGWVTSTRVVVETNHTYSTSNGYDWQPWKGAIVAFDADGGNARLIASPKDVLEYYGTPMSSAPFSVSRGNTEGFDSRVVKADQPIADLTKTDDLMLPQIEAPTLPAVEDGAQVRPAIGANQPRTLRILNYDAARPGTVRVAAAGQSHNAGSHYLSIYSLDVQTGKLTFLTSDHVLNTREALIDRQGHVRLTVPNTLLSYFPFYYAYLGPNGKSIPHKLDGAAGLSGFSVSPDNFFGSRAIPLGFDEDPNVLYYASNLDRDTYGIYSLDLTTKTRGKLTIENPSYDLIGPPESGFPTSNTLVFDRYTKRMVGVRYDNALHTTAWLLPEWQAMQTQFEKMFPGRSVEITDWDEANQRFIVSTTGPADAGAFFLYDKVKNKLFEFVRRAPWIDADHIHTSLPFSYATPEGIRISGLLTLPNHPHIKPIPMVVLCPDLPWQRVRTDYQADVQALADMGFVVVQLNGRGAWGLGLKQRQSLTAGYDLVQVEDIVATINNLEKNFKVNLKRVALMGRGHGGFIALRALQTYPDKFRCAVALDAPVNLQDWIETQKWSNDEAQPHLTRNWLGDSTRLKAAPLRQYTQSTSKPILMMNYPGLEGPKRRPTYGEASKFASDARHAGAIVEFADLSTDYMNGLPAARAEVFARIEIFLNINVFEYKVKIPSFKVIDKDVTSP